MSRPPHPLRIVFPDVVVLREGDPVPEGMEGFVVSPCNPGYAHLSAEENAARVARFPHRRVRHPVTIAGGDHEEAAFWLPVAPSEAERLAVLFGQAAYFSLLAGDVVRVVSL